MTDDVREEIRSAVSVILRGRTTGRSRPSDDFDHPVWKDLSAGGFHLLGVPEDAGGSGGRLSDLAVVLDLTAFHAVRVPVAEVAVLAGWMVARAGLSLPEGVVVASVDEARGRRRNGGLRLSGTLRVPWGRHADHVVTTVRCGDETLVALLPVATGGSTAVCLTRAENLAGEPRDTLVLDDMELAEPVAAAAPPGLDSAAILQRGALARCVQLAGSARAVLMSALRYATEREQFGRPLTRFQAVQQQLAVLAAEVTALQVSADAALLATEAEDADAGVAVAAAKATASAGAHVVAAIGHQLHGAIGYSQEHHLGAATTRLWAWREEFGSESHWHDQLAALVRQEDSWWHLVTGGE
ncbi:acyl-CoA dehydrogenase family protein [Streptomyces turgidiscabies]|uniref:acyl-CoA dehydrogenase family protein n=1 Tax=Streptomyces TaxID=1883 RepID=UPI00030C8953|nr:MULTISPECIES: acyl-CoA dehydrogenase family protein [Streptomyces]MDX3496159.1 acyl-CoA/acyl-ACP dehydrogenase [Streptomyces turgidiscabies]GAQ75346.1 glutaryl-CoA dehydrogenase [Streptomyces turgidiscabies]